MPVRNVKLGGDVGITGQKNRKGGPEGVIDAVEALAPDGFSNIDDVMSYEQRMAIVRGYASTAGFAREQVNRGKT